MGDINWMAASLQQYHMGADIRHLPCTESARIQRWRFGMLLIPMDLLSVTITGATFAKKLYPLLLSLGLSLPLTKIKQKHNEGMV